ncbi:MAG: SHOCT domain-containing protein [Desulfuromusa sp.]|jgi:putative membrane protein|nr:SHOCT domain-containing protein [Desulfuromusa sp.]
MGSGYMWSNGMGYFPIIMPIMMVVVFGVIIYFLFGRGSCSLGGNKREDSALDIAKKRYARGEIDKGEFEALRNDLE